MGENTSFSIGGGVEIGQGVPLFLIAGPCVIEDDTVPFIIAEELKKCSEATGVPVIFKASYDKANRMSIESFRGPGIRRGLEILAEVKKRYALPILTDIHSEKEIGPASEVADIIQIPAFLCRQTDLVVSAASAGKPINIKKGQFMAPWDMSNIIDKVRKGAKNNSIIITERGTSFGYNNLVADMRSIKWIRDMGVPVVFDATHSVQLPGGKGSSSGGDGGLAPVLARAAVAAGCDGVFLEVHPAPDMALSDGANMINIRELPKLISILKSIHSAVI